MTHVRAYVRVDPSSGRPVSVRAHEDRRQPPAPSTPWWKPRWWDKAAGLMGLLGRPRPTGRAPAPAGDGSSGDRSRGIQASRAVPVAGSPAWPAGWPPPRPKPPIPYSDDPAHQVMAFSPETTGADRPTELHGIPFEPMEEPESWEDYTDGVKPMREPPLEAPPGLEASAGVIMVEPDGRIWVVEPEGSFGGYHHTFPKGRVEPGLAPQQTALKEAWEESGLKARILGLLGDYRRSTTLTRYYLAERAGGVPWQAGWETQGVQLVPPKYLISHFLNAPVDHRIARDVEAKLATGRRLGDGDWKRGLEALEAAPARAFGLGVGSRAQPGEA